MRGERARPTAAALALCAVFAALASAGCGEDEERFGDGRIVDALKLEETGDGYTVGGDPFCVVSDRFFHDSEEVEAAKSDEDAGTVIASRAGNVAVEAVPPFAPDCAEQARKRLDKLDPQEDEE